MKKILACLLTSSILLSSSAFAAAPSEYDNHLYSEFGYYSLDGDQEINLAVIANNEVTIVGDASYIKGSVYSNGTIYAGNGQGNKVDGLFISSTENTLFTDGDNQRIAQGFVHVDDFGSVENINYYSNQVEHKGSILDYSTSFNCVYEDFIVPIVETQVEDFTANIYSTGQQVISNDLYANNVYINGTDSSVIIIDATNNPVNVIFNNLVEAVNPSFEVIGDNDVNIYFNNVSQLFNFTIKGNVNTNLYFTGQDIYVGHSNIVVNNIYADCTSIEIDGSSKITSNIMSNAEKLVITGGETEVIGTICAPAATSKVIDSGTLYGQIHTNNLIINGAGRIIWKKDDFISKIPTGEIIDLSNLDYAYIFGYEPEIIIENEEVKANVYMAPDDAVTREQVAAMIMRMVDQKYNTKDINYPLSIYTCQHKNAWYERGIAFLDSKQTFDDIVDCGPISRGEVAKLIAFGLNLTESCETSFTDIDNNFYKPYIEIVYNYGYMNGISENLFEPDRIMTRAEFCQMFNNIINRNEKSLIDIEGKEVTQETYSIVDLEGHWAEQAMLKATSVYDENGYVDVELRIKNIRNILDNYNSQLWF